MGNWRKSSYSSANGGDCVEVSAGGTVLIRDTAQDGTGPVLRLTLADWSRFTASLRLRARTGGPGPSRAGPAYIGRRRPPRHRGVAPRGGRAWRG
jgi:hypothetical protein